MVLNFELEFKFSLTDGGNQKKGPKMAHYQYIWKFFEFFLFGVGREPEGGATAPQVKKKIISISSFNSADSSESCVLKKLLSFFSFCWPQTCNNLNHSGRVLS